MIGSLRPSGLAFLFAFGLLFLGTWTHALWDSDEPRYAEASREMFVRGDFVVPYLNDVPRYDKPILTYWLQALGFLLFGVGELGARLPSVLGLAIAAAFTARIGSRMFGPRAGLAAGLLIPTCVQGGLIGRASTADGILLGMVMISIDALHARLRGRRGPVTWLALYGGLGLAFLAKGPPGWVAPLAAGIGALVATRKELGGRRVAGGLLGLLFALGLIAAWAVPAIVRTGGAFLREGLGYHVVERASRVFEGHGGFEPWWLLFYFPAVFVFLFPWSAWLPQAFLLWRRLDRRDDRLFLGTWVGGTLLVFTLSASKMPHYVLPLYPALAVLLGGFFAGSIEKGRSLFAGGAGRFSLWFVLGLSVLIAAGIPASLYFAGFESEWAPALSLTTLMLGLVAILLVLRKKPLPLAQGVSSLVAMTAGFLLLVLWVVPVVDRHRLVHRAGRALSRATPPGARRGYIGFRPDGLVFYSQEGLRRTTPIEKLDRGKEVLDLLRSPEPAAVVMTEQRERQILAQHGLRVLPGRLYWKERGFYARRGRWETIVIQVSEGTR